MLRKTEARQRGWLLLQAHTKTEEMACPCCSGLALAACCAPLLNGERPAATAEALMRSRFSAYVLGHYDYLLASWHPDTRPPAERLGGTGLQWLHLAIVDTAAGGMEDETGTVAFIATFREGNRVRQLHETSRFVREQGQWRYLDGDCRLSEVGRNDPCYCGSGQKFKRCCLPRLQQDQKEEKP